MVRTINVDHIEYNEVRVNENGEYIISEIKHADMVSGSIKECDLKRALELLNDEPDSIYDIIGIRITKSRDRYFMSDQYYLQHSEKVVEKENNK